MAKRQTLTVIGIVVAVLIVAAVVYGVFGSDIKALVSGDGRGGGGGGSNQTADDQNKPPEAILEADHDFIREGEAVIFDGNNSYDIDYNGTLNNNGIFLFEWDFGDGSQKEVSQNGSKMTYVYNEQGIYNVTLKVYDEYGGTDKDSVTITVVPQDTIISTGSQILIGQALIPGVGFVANSTEINWTVEDGAKVMNLTVTVSGYNFQEMKDNKIEIVLFNPYEDVLENETLEIMGQESISWDFEEEDLFIHGEYYIFIQCFEGAALVNVQGSVSYVD